MVSPSNSVTDLQGLPLAFYAPRGYRDPLPGFISRILYHPSAALLLAWAVAATVMAAGLVRLRRWTWIVPVILLASTFPHAVIVWTGDDTSIGRHAVLLAVYLRLGLILFTLQLMDALGPWDLAQAATREGDHGKPNSRSAHRRQ
jgi:hypothetical protein